MAAVSGEKTITELGSEFGVHQTLIHKWAKVARGVVRDDQGTEHDATCGRSRLWEEKVRQLNYSDKRNH
jgi:hypothetical protein